MSYKLDNCEFNAALNLNADYRYNYFITHVKKGIEVFILKSNEEVLFLETTDNKEAARVLPIWCHERYAQHYAESYLKDSGYKPQSISLAVFIEKWIPQLQNADVEFAVFPLNTEDDCNIATPDDFLKDLL